jgi:exopolysaccharide biosynthesis polyprenyl glycosylphosphotransferase
MKKSEAMFGVARLPLDALAVTAALLLAYRLRVENIDLVPGSQLLERASTLPDLSTYFSTFIVPGIAIFIVLAAFLGLYTLRSTMSAWREVAGVLIVSALWLVIVIGWYFLVLRQLFFSRALLLYAVTAMALFVTLARMSLMLLQRSFLRAGVGRMIVISVGRQALAHHAQQTLAQDEHYTYLGHLNDLQALRRFIRQRPIDLVLQTDPNPGSDETIALINECRSRHVGYGFLPPVLADVPHQLRVEHLGLLPLVRFQPTPLDGWGRVAKRIFDIVVSALALIILSPVLSVVALIILATDGRPVFYVSTRVGDHGRRRIRILKFRSMIKDADTKKEDLLTLNHRRDGPLFKIRNDPRVTIFGAFIRRWTLDELPQLFNVLLGDMSLVGPRPHLPEEVEKYTLEERRVFAVKPGMTGLSQISGRSNLTFDEEVRYDLKYIEEWWLLLDVWILWRTIWTVLGRKGAD